MSTSAEVLNTEYQQICQQLGDAALKLKQIQTLITALETKASELTNSYAIAQKIEKLSIEKTQKDLESKKIQSAEQSIMNKADKLRNASDSLSQL